MRAPLRAMLATALLFASASGCAGADEDRSSGTPQVDLVSAGREAYAANCATCHGNDLEGTNSGPPFLDPIYAPDHHSDEAFFSAVENGVQPHHWNFGAMPPQPAVSEDDVEAIVAYVRAEQRKAGIIHGSS